MTTTVACWPRGLLILALTAAAWVYAADPNDDEGDAEPTPPAFAPQPTAPAGARAPAPTPPAPPSAPAPAGPQPMKVNSNEVLLNFQAADIQAVVKAVSQMTNRNFLLDPRVKGQITIISAKPVPRAAAYQIFLSALKAQGFTAVEGPSGLVRVIPIAEAKQSADVSKDSPRGGEQMVTHVAILQNVSPTQLVPVLRPLMAPTSQLSAYEAANALILTDYADNVRRMLGIIDRIDQPISSEVTVVPLKNASALDLADLIARLAAPGSAGGIPGVPVQPTGFPVAGDRFTIIPDLRTNSLLIRTENPGRLAQLQSLISKLDVPATTGGQTRVIYLRNAEAVKLADVLRGLLAGEARSQQTGAPGAGAVPGVVGRPVGATRTGAEASLVQADEATNSLIINASDAVYNNLRAVIEKLDVRRAQVFVEALIAEITTDKAFDLGFQWASAGGVGQGAVAGFTNLPNPQNQGSIAGAIADPKSLGLLKGLQIAFLGRTIRLPDGTTVRSIGALARALESQNLANILSTPNLLTLDNAEAKIIVGQNVPFITGSFLTSGAAATATTGANPFQTIDRKDIGIQLKIKPQISEGGSVRLDIFQEISTVTAPPAGVTAADIITNKRSVETKVLVDDGNTVVLGGLIEDRISQTRSQVPFLGRIPLLGALFRSTNESKQKTNLMIFLKPTIIRSPEGNYRVTTDRYDYIRAQGVESEGVPQLDRLRPAPPPPPKAPEPEKEKDRPGTTTPPAEQRNPS
jgi:general secretion pathway protein D